MAASEIDEPLLGTLRHSIVGLVRRDGPDLSARQLAVFLACYLETEAQTVRGLAAKLNLSKPAVSRSTRSAGGVQPGPPRRRSVGSPQRPDPTHTRGLSLIQELGKIMQEASGKTSRPSR